MLRSRARLATSSIVLSLWMISCGTPTPSDLVGTWVMTADSQKNLPFAIAGSAPTLNLRADGTYSATNVPASEGGPGPGTWKIMKLDRTDKVQVSSNSGYGFQLNIDDASTLYDFVGDPDQGKRLTYRKK